MLPARLKPVMIDMYGTGNKGDSDYELIKETPIRHRMLTANSG